MKAVEELSSKNTKPKLIANFKQPERNLLSVFMSALEIVPEYRGAFLERCGYRSGKTCKYDSFMEAQYKGPKFPDVRPDGLLTCKRGTQEWLAYVEAKSGSSSIRPEQIQSYAELAKELDVDTVISISNEFALSPSELPYHMGIRQKKGRDVFHFSWAELRTFTEIFVGENDALNDTESALLRHCLDYLWDEKSGIQNYDAMPKEWPNFVQSAGTELGFTTKTPGITEIVHGWQQERRDLSAKILNEIKVPITLRHDAGARADTEQRLKYDRKELAEHYILAANYWSKESDGKIRVLANLKSCHMSVSLEFTPPESKKAKATVSWVTRLFDDIQTADTKISFDWKGRGGDTTLSLEDFLSDPDLVADGQQDAPKSIRIIREIHDVRRFKSRKGFIQDLEKMTLDLANTGRSLSIF